MMPSNVVRCGLVQATNVIAPTADTSKMSEEKQKQEVFKIRDAMIQKHLKLIEKAAKKGAKVVCLQEIFAGPYFCAEIHHRWFHLAEPVPDGHTTQIMIKCARKLGIVLIVPLYEKAATGVYYNTAVVIDGDGKVLGTYRKNHIPDIPPGFSEKFYFKPGNLGYPTFKTDYGTLGVYICYDRHFPEGARLLGLNGAEIVFNPSATIEGISRYLWELEQPAHAVANGYFMGAINRVGIEAPFKSGMFYGSSYFCNPRGQIIAQGSPDKDDVVVADLNLDEIRQVRNLWQFYRDRRPETYGDLVKLLP
jgi:N-carbamoylputrescine amidase